MNSLILKYLVAFVAVLAAGLPSVFGANVVLRAKSNHQGTMIRLGDIVMSGAAMVELGKAKPQAADVTGTNTFIR